MHKNKNFFIVLFLFAFAAGTFVFIPETSAAGLQYELLEKIPGTNGLGSDLKGYIEAIYKVALIVITLSAVLMLSVGGFMYLTSAGNTAAMSSAKSIIFDALIGLVIALSASLLLFVINPDLVKVSLNGLSPIPITQQPAGGVKTTGPLGRVSSGTYAGTNVGGCVGCVPVTSVTGIVMKTVAEGGCKSPGPCQLNEIFLNKLKNIHSTQSWRVTEAWPPTIIHKSLCHGDGTCADINFTDQSKNSSVTAVKTFFTAIINAGFYAGYETEGSCTEFINAGVPCLKPPTMKGSHFHVY